MNNINEDDIINNKGVLISIVNYPYNVVIKTEMVPESCGHEAGANVSLVRLATGGFAVCDKSFNDNYYTTLWEDEDDARTYFNKATDWFIKRYSEDNVEYQIKLEELKVAHRITLSTIYDKHTANCSVLEKVYADAHGAAKSIYDSKRSAAVAEYNAILVADDKEYRMTIASLEAGYELSAYSL